MGRVFSPVEPDRFRANAAGARCAVAERVRHPVLPGVAERARWIWPRVSGAVVLLWRRLRGRGGRVVLGALVRHGPRLVGDHAGGRGAGDDGLDAPDGDLWRYAPHRRGRAGGQEDGRPLRRAGGMAREVQDGRLRRRSAAEDDHALGRFAAEPDHLGAGPEGRGDGVRDRWCRGARARGFRPAGPREDAELGRAVAGRGRRCRGGLLDHDDHVLAELP